MTTIQPKQFVAKLTQEGQNVPTINILLNELGGVPVITREQNGVYVFTLPGAFPANKTTGFTSAGFADVITDPGEQDFFYIETRDYKDGLTNISLIVNVYQ